MKFDFSQFHPLDHHPWERRCRELPGGWRRHLYLTWEYKAMPVARWWVRRPAYLVLCPLGRHDLAFWWSEHEGYNAVCEYCDYKRVATKEEFDR